MYQIRQNECDKRSNGQCFWRHLENLVTYCAPVNIAAKYMKPLSLKLLFYIFRIFRQQSEDCKLSSVLDLTANIHWGKIYSKATGSFLNVLDAIKYKPVRDVAESAEAAFFIKTVKVLPYSEELKALLGAMLNMNYFSSSDILKLWKCH